jgi:ATP-dependent Lon protease
MVSTRSSKKPQENKIKLVEQIIMSSDSDTEDGDESFEPSSIEDSNEEDTDSNTNSNSNLNEEEDDEYEEDIEDFMLSIPEELHTNVKLKKIFERVKHDIKTKRTPDICNILKSRITFQQKVDLFELYILYDNAEPFTEEQFQYREVLNKLLPMYKKEYKHNSKYRSQLKEMEKKINILSDMSLWPSKIITLPTSEVNKESIFKKYNELKNMDRDDEEYGKLERWMKLALTLPYNNVVSGSIPTENTHFTEYLYNVKKKLDDRLYGMNDVKEQIMLFLHIKLRNPTLQGCCLGLIGPVGAGKTSVARCLSEVLEFPFQQISFGGINNSEFLKGYHYTYVGSRPGEIVNCVIRMKYSNGILFFDEYEKASQNPDIQSTLLHITDFSQNSAFRDNYLCDLELDLSRIWFIYSMNELPEDSALRDRIFPIYIKGYNHTDKVRIIVDYLFPKHLENLSIKTEDVIITDNVASHIIQSSQINSSEKGIRTIEKAVKDIVNKISFLMIHNCEKFQQFSFINKKSPSLITLPFHLTNEHVDRFLVNFKSHLKNNYTENMYL